jgi:pectinesterase
MSNVVRTEGWKIWSDGQSTANIFYGEYGNSGEGSTGTRVGWSRKLGAAVSIAEVLGSNYASQPWFDAAYPN